MALPSAQRADVDRLLGEFCRNRVPAKHRNVIRYEYSVRGNSVTLTESRPAFDGGDQWTQLVIAQFRFNAATSRWTLYWRRASERWQLCDWFPPAERFAAALSEIVTDSYGAFFG
jgi:Protein of unknown function (DUF3024)